MHAQAAQPGSRPRVEGLREQQIFDAAVDLVTEAGYDRLTLDAVAARARASKATLYRRWASKAELVVDAVGCLGGQPPDPPDTGSLRGDLLATISAKRKSLFSTDRAELFMGLLTAMNRDAELGAAIRTRFLAPLLANNAAMLQRARDRGEVAEDVDLDLIGSILPAMVFYRLSVTGLAEPLDVLAEKVVDEVVLPAVRVRR